MAEGGLLSESIVRRRNLEDHLCEFPLRLLDTPCDEQVLIKLTSHFSEWQCQLAAALQLTDVEVEDIESEWKGPERQRVQMFRRWRRNLSSQATYRRLITALHEAGKIDVIDSLLHLVSTTPPQTNTQFSLKNEKLVWYGNYLKQRHLQVHITAHSIKWLPSPTQKIFNLAIIKKERIQRGKIDDDFVQKSIQGQIDDILLKKSPIKLEEIFMEIKGERKVILIDGAPGSGKSTLTVHICQKWSRGELFEEFTVVILVQLRDPAVQTAQSIADLLPRRNKEMAKDVAKAITASDGSGVLWILDGWDELPSHLRKASFLRDMIFLQIECPIIHSSVIVTSRPISSGDLSEFVSSRIEVLGFTREEQKLYLTECLKGDAKAVDDLLERLSEEPSIESSCCLPLNASIVAHLYLCDGSIPDTVYGMFSLFIQHFLSRYLCERLGKSQEEARLQSLDNLPSELHGPFHSLCELAFKRTSEKKVTFSGRDLNDVNDSAVIRELGLLQATQSILSTGREVFYNFVHLMVQEVLSAIYISRLPASEQISTLDSLRLHDESRLGPVLQHFAAVTKLSTSRSWLSMLPISEGTTDQLVDFVKKIITMKNKPLLVSLLHCLYEAQDPSLCQFVAKQLRGRLDLFYTSLTPVDCLAIGYFISSVVVTTSSKKLFRVNLNSCSLGDAGTKSLMHSISRHVDLHSTVSTHVNILLIVNDIHEESASHIAEVLNNTSIVKELWLNANPIGNRGLQTIFNTLKNNNTLRGLHVDACDMTDAGVVSLAEAMNTNTTLERLDIDYNAAITDDGLRCLVEVLSRSSRLVALLIPGRLKVDEVRKTINEARERRGLGAIRVTDFIPLSQSI